MVTSSAVVGSSAISSRGLAGQRHGDQRPLAHAAGQLVRVVLEPPVRVGDADPVEQVARPPAWPPLRYMPRCRSSTSVTCSADRHHRVQRATAGPGRSSRCRGRGGRASPSRRARAGRCPRRRPRPRPGCPRLGSRPMIASEVTDLPQPDSPTRPTVWPGRTSKLTPSTAVNGFSPCRVKVTRRSRTESRLLPDPCERCRRDGHRRSPPALGVEGLAQRLAHQGEAERDDDDAQRRVDRQVRVVVDVRAARRPSIWPHSGTSASGLPRPRKDSAAASMIDGRQHQGGLHDDRAERVGQHVPEDDRRSASRRAPGRPARGRCRAGRASSRAAAGRRSGSARRRWR